MKFGKSPLLEKSPAPDASAETASVKTAPSEAAPANMASADGIPILDDILAERGARYGSFEDNAAIVQRLKRAMRGTDGWNRLSDAQREGLEMMVGKIGRMLSGDPTYLDNGTDLAGYARLVLEAMQRAERARADKALVLRALAERSQ